MNLTDFAYDIHQNSVAHGWWDEERSFDEVLALIHSELSEALEEYRAGRPNIWHACDMPDSDGTVICGGSETPDCYTLMHGGAETCEYYTHKPEGVAVELADAVIRIFDWFGKMHFNTAELIGEAHARSQIWTDIPPKPEGITFGGLIARWHFLLSLAYQRWTTGGGYHSAALRLALAVIEITLWIDTNCGESMDIISLKHEYNKTRSYRHGGKLL